MTYSVLKDLPYDSIMYSQFCRANTDCFFYFTAKTIANIRIFTREVNTTVALSDVCTETLDPAEYHVMINSGNIPIRILN